MHLAIDPRPFPCCLAILSLIPAADGDIHAWKVDNQDEWTAVTGKSEGLECKEGLVLATEKEGYFSSSLIRYESLRKAASLEIRQSPRWDNWDPVPDVGPSNLSDAPVFLRVDEGNYWMFGRYEKAIQPRQNGKKTEAAAFQREKATLEGFDGELFTTTYPNQYDASGGLRPGKGGYHAWQSKDMVNWVHHGPITDSVGKWMTSAEWKDGKAYFYYDFPNDQDPHLYLDDDLTDGEPGRNVGLAFLDPSHGSDAGIIRGLDGKFHLIFEDWTPIDASKRSWDSPLAGHAVSETGHGDFKIMPPAVDHRTKPTGKILTYLHPHWRAEDPKRFPSNVAEYELPEPEQPAYGDWAAIAVGGRYYLFGDHEPAGGHQMSVGIFTSPSIDEPFTWSGQLGKGHPDPDIIFAEGRFYLATQQSTDFVSTGPWVETVEARVGVDTTNDGKGDQWTDWQEVRENYRGIPGFAKQVAKTPASMDLSKLPAGFGFQVEMKIRDATGNASRPVIDGFRVVFSE